jgi:hypothetical protein
MQSAKSKMLRAATAATASLSTLAIGGILPRAAVFLGITVGLGCLASEHIVRFAARTGKPDILLMIGLSLCFPVGLRRAFVRRTGR